MRRLISSLALIARQTMQSPSSFDTVTGSSIFRSSEIVGLHTSIFRGKNGKKWRHLSQPRIVYKEVFEVKEDAPWWYEPHPKDVLIVNIDTRVPDGPNELWHEGRLNWAAMDEGYDGGMVSASFMSHFLYCMFPSLPSANPNSSIHLTHQSANSRLRLPLLQRPQTLRSTQHMGETARPRFPA
jgi:hypothetical protein